MRKFVTGLVALGLVAGTGVAASAANLAFTGTLSIAISALDPLVIPGSGTAVVNGAGAEGALDSLSLAGATFMAASVFIPITDPAAAPILAIQANASNGAGAFAPTGTAGFGGPMPVLGQTVVCLYVTTCDFVNLTLPFTQGGSVGAGLGGSIFLPATSLNPVGFTIQGAPWTVGAATAAAGPITATTATVMMTGFAHGPASGGLSSAGQGSGVVQLVTPLQVLSNIGPSGKIPVFGILQLEFEGAPEPGAALMLITGAGCLVLAGRRRMRS